MNIHIQCEDKKFCRGLVYKTISIKSLKQAKSLKEKSLIKPSFVCNLCNLEERTKYGMPEKT